MILTALVAISSFSLLTLSADAAKHGQGAEGTEMGPVAFLWPADRVWDAKNDNTGPCGSAAGVSNRTEFPISAGSVALTIADDSYNVAIRVSYSNDPKVQSDFGQQIVTNVSEVEPGHQCYKIGRIPETVKAGANGTIQLEYWGDYPGENNGKNESFFACADVTFIEPASLKSQIPCFNVTSDDFNAPSVSSSASPSSPSSTSATTHSPAPATSEGGLTGGAKAGIAVGTIAGSFAIVGIVAWAVLRRRRGGGVEEYALSDSGKSDGQRS